MAQSDSISQLNNAQVSRRDNGLDLEGTQTRKPTKEFGSTEFMTLLVAQLKNQDPTNPLDSQQFTQQLATFTSLEQLVGINEKLKSAQTNTFSALTGYLGREIILHDDQITVNQGDGGRLRFTLDDDADIEIDLLNSDGAVVETLPVDGLSKGEYSMALTGLNAHDGQYSYRVRANSTSGVQFEAAAQVSGIVSGIVPGDPPVLMLGGREILLSDIKEVMLAPSE